MADRDRDELIEDITNAEITIQSNGQVVTICLGESVATAMVDQDGIDLGGGRRIAIIEPFNPTWGWDGEMVGWKEQPFRIVTPDPGEA